jgi:hypothetical protein
VHVGIGAEHVPDALGGQFLLQPVEIGHALSPVISFCPCLIRRCASWPPAPR